MRQWQVGDPAGDGNDIGVPDTGYMGYLRSDDEDFEYDILEEFKANINHSRYCYGIAKYDEAFRLLESSYNAYEKMNAYQKSQIRDDPFNRYWIIDLCCRMINRHGRYYQNATEILLEHHLHVSICMDCDCVYPPDYKCCIECGKVLLRPYEKSIQQIGEEIPNALRGIVFDEDKIQRLVERSIKLMKSNDCRLVRIEEGINWTTDFIFEKEHKYFKTTYACEYNPNYYGPLIFEEFGTTHNYDKLLADESFKKLIKDTENRTGFLFKECSGGFGYQLDDDGYDFIFNDEISVTAVFDVGDGKTAVYDVDLDNMKLSDDYRMY